MSDGGTAERVAPDPALVRLSDYSARLNVDIEVARRFSGRAPKVKTEFQETVPGQRACKAVVYMRTAVVIGYHGAVAARANDYATWAKEYEDLQRHFKRLDDVVDEIISVLDKRALRSAALSADTRVKLLANPIMTSGMRPYDGTANASDRWRISLDDASAILRVQELAESAREHLPKREHGAKRPNDVGYAADEAAFVRPLAEMWLYLTGRKPGAQKDLTNPFLRLVTAAWRDAFGESDEEPSFNAALETLEGMSKLPGDELWRTSVIEFGPSWLRAEVQAEVERKRLEAHMRGKAATPADT
jgi:hypothetical protein